MAINITLTLGAGLGANLGPNFNLTADVGSVSPSTATKAELLAGKIVDVDNAASQVTVISTGACTNAIAQAIPCASTTTTTTTINPTNNLKFSNVAISRDDVTGSNDGKYVAVVCGSNNKLYISNDYGLTYRSVTIAGANTLQRVAVSGTGQYMYCLSQPQGQAAVISRSTDYGVNWNATGGVTNSFYSVTTNRTGQYVLVAAMNITEATSGQFGIAQLWRSSDYGVSFSRVQFATANGEQAVTDVAISSSGDRQYAVSPNFYLGGLDACVGKTTVPSQSSLNVWARGYEETYYAVSTSADGSKVVVATQAGTYGYASGNIQLIQSTNYGNSFVDFGGVSSKWYDITIDGSGTNIIALSSDITTLYKSVSFGTLSAVGSSKAWVSVSISYSAAVAIASETTGLWRSTDGGSTWTKLP
jgi:hypothetical protein